MAADIKKFLQSLGFGDDRQTKTGGVLPQIEDQNPLGYNAGNTSSTPSAPSGMTPANIPQPTGMPSAEGLTEGVLPTVGGEATTPVQADTNAVDAAVSEAQAGAEDTGQTQKPFNADLEPLDSRVVFSDPQMSFIVALESFREKPYELNSTTRLAPLSHKSGLTVANGFDVGQHTEATLLNLGFPQELIDKFGDWVNLNPDTIVDPDYNVAASDLTLTDIQEIVGVEPDGVYGPNTERAIRTYLENNNQSTGRLDREGLLKGVRRVRGHEAMADTFEEAKANGTLPSFSLAELEDISIKSWESLGMDAAKSRYGEGFDNLPEDVQAVLASEAYVMGSGRMTQTALDRARAGQSAADVVAAMPDLHGRKSRVEAWLANNSFNNERAMSDQGLQIMTNRLMDSLGLDGNRLTVDAQIGPGSRRAIDRLLIDQGKIQEGQRISTPKRKELLQELYYESSILPPSSTTGTN